MRTSATKQKDLSVYDFDEREESVEALAGKMKSRFEPKPGNPGDEMDKYQFLQAFTSGFNLDQKEVTEDSCVDLCERDNTRVSSYAVDSEEDEPSLFEEKSDFDEVISSPTNSDEHGQMSQDESEPDSLSGAYPPVMGDSGVQESPEGAMSDDEECLDSGSPSTFGSEHSENEGLLCSDIYPSNGERAVVIFTDYLLYGRTVYMDSEFGFFSDCIKMVCFDASGNCEKFVIERRLADIIQIDCYWKRSAEVAVIKVCFSSTPLCGTEKVNDDPDIQKLIFSVAGIQWMNKEQKIKSLATRYKDVWIAHSNDDCVMEEDFLEQTFISKHYFTEIEEPFEDVIYPKGDPDAVSISKRDIELLQPDTFINDTIIDFYIKFLKNKIQPGERHRFHFFNSFFFRKLADLDKDPGSALEARAAFLRVRKWTRKVNIFDKDFIFIPVNYNLHWSLLVICHPGHVANVQDDGKESRKISCILHMDSIKGSHSGLRSLIQSYLREEWKDRYPESEEEILSKFSNLRFVELELPQQENFSDCGLFLLHYVELFLEKVPTNFNLFKITKLSRFLTADWFSPSEASLKRTVIRKLIYDLLKDPSLPSLGYTETENKQEPAVGLLSEFCSEAKPEFNDSTDFVPDGRIEIKLLTADVPIVAQSEKEGFVLREFLAPRAAAVPSSDCRDQLSLQNSPSQKLKFISCAREEPADTSDQRVGERICSTSYASKYTEIMQELEEPADTSDQRVGERICSTSYASEDTEIMQELEELGADSLPSSLDGDHADSLPGSLNGDHPGTNQTEQLELLPKSCGYVPDSPTTSYIEKKESGVADPQKMKAEGSHCTDSQGVGTSNGDDNDSQRIITIVEVEDGEGEDLQDTNTTKANGVIDEDIPNMDNITATSGNCRQTNTTDIEGGSANCQETDANSENCVTCHSAQSWQEIVSSDEESTLDKDEASLQPKRRKLMVPEGGRRRTRSSARSGLL